MNETHDQRQVRLLDELRSSGATIEDLARALASLEKDEMEFDADKAKGSSGCYLGYLSEMEEIVIRATRYARARK
jgi:hypothetical protein